MTTDREQLEKCLLTGEELLKLGKKVHSWSLCLGEFPPISGRKTHSCTGWRCGLGGGQAAEQLEMRWGGGGRGSCLWKQDQWKDWDDKTPCTPDRLLTCRELQGALRNEKLGETCKFSVIFVVFPNLHSLSGRGGNLIGLRYVNTISAQISPQWNYVERPEGQGDNKQRYPGCIPQWREVHRPGKLTACWTKQQNTT